MEIPLTLKIFADESACEPYLSDDAVVEVYDSFIVAKATNDQLQEFISRFPVEDISTHYGLKVGSQAIDTEQPRITVMGTTSSHAAYRGVKKLSKGPHHYLVQFIGPIKKSWLTALKRCGAEPREPYKYYSYIVRCDEKTLAEVAKLKYVRWVGHFSHRDRIKAFSSALDLPRTRQLPGAFLVQFFDQKDFKKGISKVRGCGAKVLAENVKGAAMIIEVTGSKSAVKKCLAEISGIHGIRTIEPNSIMRTSNDVAPGVMNTLNAETPTIGLTGRGEIIAVCDTGLDTGEINNIHPDFEGRVNSIQSFPITASFGPLIHNPGADDGPSDVDSGHGTHVSGSVLASGISSIGLPGQFRPIRGLAYEAELIFQAVEQELDWKNFLFEQEYGRFLLAGIPDDLNDLFNPARTQGARIHTNSWGGGLAGAYSNSSWQVDDFVWRHKDFCILFAAGNDGTDIDGDGRINQMSVTAPGTAKNCITVGACESLRPQFNHFTYGMAWPSDYPVAPYRDAALANNTSDMAAFSSRGPTEDGRIKPDIVAPGTFILSTRSRKIASNNVGWGRHPTSNLYFYNTGTSMATPLTAGGVALLRQFFREWVGILPSAALLKATLITSAAKLPSPTSVNPIFDIDQGFGLVNIDSIVDPADGIDVFFYDDELGLETGMSDAFEFNVDSSDIPVRCVMAYTDFPGEALINNLNLILTAPDGTRFSGNVGASGTLVSDQHNNVEVVHIINPLPGRWSLEVIASNIPQGPQDYAFCIKGNLSM